MEDEHDEVTDAYIRRATMRLVQERGPTKTICPSEVARQVAPSDWRPLLDRVRDQAAVLAEQGQLYVEQEGSPVDPSAATGPIRLRWRPTASFLR